MLLDMVSVEFEVSTGSADVVVFGVGVVVIEMLPVVGGKAEVVSVSATDALVVEGVGAVLDVSEVLLVTFGDPVVVVEFSVEEGWVPLLVSNCELVTGVVLDDDGKVVVVTDAPLPSLWADVIAAAVVLLLEVVVSCVPVFCVGPVVVCIVVCFSVCVVDCAVDCVVNCVVVCVVDCFVNCVVVCVVDSITNCVVGFIVVLKVVDCESFTLATLVDDKVVEEDVVVGLTRQFDRIKINVLVKWLFILNFLQFRSCSNFSKFFTFSL